MEKRSNPVPYVKPIKYSLTEAGMLKLAEESDKLKAIGYEFITVVTMGIRAVAFYKRSGSGDREYPAFVEQEGSDESEAL